jgi:hypothetical protein
VERDPWCDYVIKKNYSATPLSLYSTVRKCFEGLRTTAEHEQRSKLEEREALRIARANRASPIAPNNKGAALVTAPTDSQMAVESAGGDDETTFVNNNSLAFDAPPTVGRAAAYVS